MKQKLLKTMRMFLAAALLGVGTTSAWAAGYTRTLTDELTVAGYKAKAFYNFQNNDPEVLPTSGDLRYREGGNWGLHNFGSGTRSATATIPVSENDILVLQHYSSDVSTINRGTLNSTLTSSTGYEVYDISTTADDITFTIARYGGIVAAFVMEKDNDVTTADYTVNYKVNGVGENVKTTEGNTAVGTLIYAETSFYVGNVKYVLNGDQTTSMTITAGTNTLNINVKEADKYTYTVNAIISGESTILKQLATGSIYADESATVPYPAYILNGGTLYSCGATSSAYRKSFAITTDNQVSTIDYSADAITNAVFFSEGEELSGVTINTTGTNVAIRASNAAAASIDGDVTICNLPAGKYVIVLGMHHTKNNAEVTTALTCGTNNISVTTNGTNRVTGTSEEFTISESTNLVLNSIEGNGLLDYILIKRTSVSTTLLNTYGTIASAYALDCANLPTGLTAYQVTSIAADKVTLTQVTEAVAAGTGLILKGTGGETYDIPVVASGTDISATNKLKAAVTATDVDANAAYVLYKDEFRKATNASSVPAGKAYLLATDVPAEARSLTFNFGDATGISAIAKSQEPNANGYYNLAGQRVAQPQKGLYIQDGKKVIIK